jgi:hypothetical protein
MKIEYNQEEVRQRVAKVIELGNYKSTRSFSIDVGLLLCCRYTIEPEASYSHELDAKT